MFDILSIIPGKKKRTSSGWTSFNCPMCVSLGHRADKRARGGIKFEETHNWNYHCFNCSFTCSFSLGESISFNTRKLLICCGVDSDQIQRWSFESFRQRGLIEAAIGHKQKPSRLDFPICPLPEADLIDVSNPAHAAYVSYLRNRGIVVEDYPYMVSPNDTSKNDRNKHRIIVPFTHNGKIVGYTSRYTDNKIPKYINHTPVGYVFGLDLQKSNSAVCILTEGIFDALSIGGCAIMHDDISEGQARLLTSLNRRIIYVPDRDKTGLEVCDRALELGYSVSIPNWEHGIKDTNDAVLKYGKLPTLLSILEAATRSAARVRIKRNNLAKRI